jgi:Kef-type K+ transport system membrane component KefB
VIRAFVLLAIVAMLVAAARSFLPQETALVGSGAALAFGFVLLAALQAGTIFSGIRLPRLTGYLVCGFLVGPSVFNLVTDRMVQDLKLVNGIAIGLIALTAGGELNFKRLRGRLGSIVSMGGLALVLATSCVSVAVYLLADRLPFMEGMEPRYRAVVALTMGVVFSALSPAVTIALISETGAAGPVSDFALGLVVVADMTIVLAFAAVKALANAVFGAQEAGGAAQLVIHLFGSIAAGLVLGLVFLLYLKKVNRRVALFTVGVCFLCAEAGSRLHLDPMLTCLTAGLFLENLTEIEGSKLVHEIQPAAMPVFAVFFAVAGAGLHWEVFKIVAPVAAALAAVRGGALYLGGNLGMIVGGVAKDQRRFLHYAMYSQSGVAIGLAILLAKHFAGWGEGASACILGGVMINEMVGPILFKSALVRSGETGRREAAAAGH